MHGGFENETPNIPTNTIVKLDLLQIFKGNATLTTKLEAVIGPGGTGANRKDTPGSSRPGSTSPSDGSSTGSRTPPLTGGSKSPTIKYDRAQIVVAPGERPKPVSIEELEEEKSRSMGGGLGGA